MSKAIVNKRRKELSEKRKVPSPSSSKLVYSVCHNGITFLPIQSDTINFEGPLAIKAKLQNQIIPLLNKQCSKIWFENYLFCQKQKVFEKIYLFLKILYIILGILIIVYLFVPIQAVPPISDITILIILIFWLACTLAVFYIFFVPFHDYLMDELIKGKISETIRVHNVAMQRDEQYKIKYDQQCLWICVSPASLSEPSSSQYNNSQNQIQ